MIWWVDFLCFKNIISSSMLCAPTLMKQSSSLTADEVNGFWHILISESASSLYGVTIILCFRKSIGEVTRDKCKKTVFMEKCTFQTGFWWLASLWSLLCSIQVLRCITFLCKIVVKNLIAVLYFCYGPSSDIRSLAFAFAYCVGQGSISAEITLYYLVTSGL
jgi:hypothetical protein